MLQMAWVEDGPFIQPDSSSNETLWQSSEPDPGSNTTSNRVPALSFVTLGQGRALSSSTVPPSEAAVPTPVRAVSSPAPVAAGPRFPPSPMPQLTPTGERADLLTTAPGLAPQKCQKGATRQCRRMGMTFQTRPKGTGHSLTRRASTLGRSLTAMPPPPSASTAKTTRPDPPPQDNDSTYPNVGSYPMSTYGATTGFPLAEGRPGDTYRSKNENRAGWPRQTADQPPVKDRTHWPQQTAEQPQAI